MTAWQILGIAPTPDQRAIKRAYAKQLKTIDQEKNPEDFLRLREALERAQYEAEYLDNEHKDNDFDHFFSNSDDQHSTHDPSSFTQEYDTPNTPQPAPQEHNLIEHLYNSLQNQVEQNHSTLSIQTTLTALKPHIEQLSSEHYDYYLEKIGYLLYTHDLESLFEFILPLAQQERSDLFNIPMSDDIPLAAMDSTASVNNTDALENTPPVENTSQETPTTDLTQSQSETITLEQPEAVEEPITTENLHTEAPIQAPLYHIPIFDDEDTPPSHDATPSTTSNYSQHDHHIIEEAYLKLAEQLSYQDAYFSIHDALFDIPKKLSCLDQNLQLHYQQKFFDLLSEYQQEQWFFFILHEANKNESPLQPEDAFTQNSVTDPTTATPPQVFSEPQPDFFDAKKPLIDPTVSLTQKVDQLQQQLYNEDFSHSVYLHYVQILEDLQSASLEQQLDLKELLENILADVIPDPMHIDFIRFVRLWDYYYPLQDDCIHSGYNIDRLKAVLDEHQTATQLIPELPENLKEPIKSLFENKPLQSLQMISLYRYISKNLDTASSSAFFKTAAIQNKAYNINYLFLTLIETLWQPLWWIIFTIATLSYFNSVLDLSPIALILVLIPFSLFQMFLQIRAAARILARENAQDFIQKLNLIWFLSGILLCISPIFIADLLTPHLHYIWVLYGLVLFKIAQYQYPDPIINFLGYSKSLATDPWVIAITTLLLISMLQERFMDAAALLNPMPSLWNLCFMMIPIGFLMFNPFFTPLYQRLGYRLDTTNAETASATKQVFAHTLFILFRSLFIFIPAYFLLQSPNAQFQFILAGTFFLSLLLLTFSTHTSYYLLKYSCYVLLMVGFVAIDLGWFSIIFAVVLLMSIRSDLKFRQATA